MDTIPNRFGKVGGLFQFKLQVLGKAHLQLGPGILKSKFTSWCPTESVIGDNLCADSSVNDNSSGTLNLFPGLIHHIIDEK